MQLNFHTDPRESISLNGKDYKLVQFHIHTPSEHLWHGQSFAMEIHFVHQGENGELAVIGVFVKGGAENSALQKIVNNLPERNGIEQTINGEQINPADLLPAKHDYYSYAGSLTTPPCSEGVQWIVLSEPITASPAQILKIRKAAKGANARPMQALNERELMFSPA